MRERSVNCVRKSIFFGRKQEGMAAANELTCKICGSHLYSTDHGNHEITYHCSSPEARFWDFERGTPEQVTSKDHWDRSRLEVFYNNES